MIVQDILSPAKVIFNQNDTLLSAISALSENRHSCILICNEMKIAGILTERDIVRIYASYIKSKNYQDPILNDIMTPNPITITSDMKVSVALAVAQSYHLRHLPVVDNQQNIIGIVTQTNLLKAYFSLSKEKNQLEKVNQKLHSLSLQDPLTGLHNRRAMEIDLKHAETISKRRNEAYAIALLDIDYFKLYNDYYGHDAGDKALRHVSDLIKTSIRGSDKAYRFGGEEFLCLLPDTNIDGAKIVCERIRSNIFDSQFKHDDSPHKYLTISIGFSAVLNSGWEQLLKEADNALYKAKHSGRNTICIGNLDDLLA